MGDDISLGKVKALYTEMVNIEANINSMLAQILASQKNQNASKAIENRTQAEWRQLLADALRARVEFFDLLGTETLALKAAKSEMRAEVLNTLGTQLNQILDSEWRTSVSHVDVLLSQSVGEFNKALQAEVVRPTKETLGKASASLAGDIDRVLTANRKSQIWTTLAACIATGTIVGVLVGHWVR